MRILIIHNRYQQTGGEDVAVELESELLRQKGHEVELMIFDNDLINGTLKKIQFGLTSMYNWQSAGKVAGMLKSFNPDVVHVHNVFFQASPSVLRVIGELRKPVVQTLHNFKLVCANSLFLRDNRPCELCRKKTFPLDGIRYKCYRNSLTESALTTAITSFHKMAGTWNKVSRFLVLTKFALEKMSDSSLRADTRKYTILPNFVYDEGMGNTPRENFYLFVGRLSKEKGADILIKAFAGLPGQNLVIAGTGPELDNLELMSRELPNVSFIGKKSRKEILDLMKRCKALLFPSIWYEGLPFTIIESFSAGTPVFASRLGAMEGLINDGVNGFHFSPGDAADLQNKINRFEQETTGRQRYYDNARQTYSDNYTPQKHYNALLQIYTEVIAEHGLKPVPGGKTIST